MYSIQVDSDWLACCRLIIRVGLENALGPRWDGGFHGRALDLGAQGAIDKNDYFGGGAVHLSTAARINDVTIAARSAGYPQQTPRGCRSRCENLRESHARTPSTATATTSRCTRATRLCVLCITCERRLGV